MKSKGGKSDKVETMEQKKLRENEEVVRQNLKEEPEDDDMGGA